MTPSKRRAITRYSFLLYDAFDMRAYYNIVKRWLQYWHIRQKLVGALGLEPRASWSQTMRASQLRHAPIIGFRIEYFPEMLRNYSTGQYGRQLCYTCFDEKALFRNSRKAGI